MFWNIGGIREMINSPGPRHLPEHPRTAIFVIAANSRKVEMDTTKYRRENKEPPPQTVKAGFSRGGGGKEHSGAAKAPLPAPFLVAGQLAGRSLASAYRPRLRAQRAVPASAGCPVPLWPSTRSGGGIGFTWPLASLRVPLSLFALAPGFHM